MNRIFLPVLVTLGLLAFAAVVWLAGPFIAIADVRPLGSAGMRSAVIAVAALAVGLVYGIRFWRRRQRQRALEAALTAESGEAEIIGDEAVLSDRMADALAVLKKSSGRSTYLYELPWYLIIGPPGSGKTTALVNSGLEFPLAGPGGPAAVAGAGGTRYCDFWFTEDAVLIDTAGRYTTQDSDAKADAKSWLGFLALLKASRPRQPINGVIVAISLEDLMTLPAAETEEFATRIRDRLTELHRELKVDFPVYALFTKADLVAGFSDYFGSFTKARRQKVWGATVQSGRRDASLLAKVPEEFDALVRRLTEELTDRLHEEPDRHSRIAIYGFPAQFAMLREAVLGMLGRIFEPTRYRAKASLRGFYFTSGTQEGTPIDQLLGAMAGTATSGSPDRRSAGGLMSGLGRSFFLHDLLKKVIFAEAGLVSHDRAAVMRGLAVRYGAFAAIGLVAFVLAALWGLSYVANRSLIAETRADVERYQAAAGADLDASEIADAEVAGPAAALDILRTMEVGYDNRDRPVPLAEGFGLAVRPELVSAAGTGYQAGLDRMLKSRILIDVENHLAGLVVANQPMPTFDALKVYLMLSGQAAKVDAAFVGDWLRQNLWQDAFVGQEGRRLTEALDRHVAAMLAFARRRNAEYGLNADLVDDARKTLARMTIADQVYAAIQSGEAGAVAAYPDFVLADRIPQDADLVLRTRGGTPIESVRIAMLYTYSGFHEVFLERLSQAAQRFDDNRWVLGDYGDQTAIENQMANLGPELLERYGRDFVAAWEGMLDDLELQPMAADKPFYRALGALGAPTSPLVVLVEEVARETELTRGEAEGQPGAGPAGNDGSVAAEVASAVKTRISDRLGGLSRIGLDIALRKSQSRLGAFAGANASNPAELLSGRNVEARFRAYHQLVDGTRGSRPIDALRQNFAEVHKTLVTMEQNPASVGQGEAAMQGYVGTLRSTISRLPEPVARMVQSAVNDIEGGAVDASKAELEQDLQGRVTRDCRRIVEGRYPFDRRSTSDVSIAEFSRLFSPDGIVDRFFQQKLASYADLSGKTWRWRDDTPLGRSLSPATLAEFQRAATIRDAFFPQGGGSPKVTLRVEQTALDGAAQYALLTVDDEILQTYAQGFSSSQARSFEWPGADGGEVMVHLMPPIEGREHFVKKVGPWALMRMIAAGSPQKRGDVIQLRYPIGGRSVSYQVKIDTALNPFYLPALTEFQCPAAL
ncbi:type VI secretion system membrane subunit TssM [Jiella avicenniae]|uniref:Type VI secretion system membrane subunit TssM n=1 Tax=Jiella avicenniae TaxID=2907202 RepID=A0A9X1NX89_9HYPH|nr:type VI secretion system membrane subunit TssM [Jiella avicenniae]MCE7027495.1 type VI secretion system membrane subunit TssM [Jiella avicenniae]